MSLMEFLEIREGRLAPVYEVTPAPIRCDWCDCPIKSVLSFGAMCVCPECFDEAEKKWKSTFSDDGQDLVKTKIGQ